MILLARRGIFWVVLLFIRGIMRGDPTSIVIGVVILLGIIGWTMYKSHVKANQSDVADYAQQFNKPSDDDRFPNR